MNYLSIEENMKNKIAFVTGGTSGIGKTCVEMFCEVGMNVVTIGRRVSLGKKLEEEINSKGKGSCKFYECDVRDALRLKEVIDETANIFGRIDVLVNCAGINPLQARIDEWSEEDLDNVISVNLKSYLLASKYVMPYLRASKGNIVNIGSVHGTTSVQGAVGYDATKGAIDSITRTMAIDEALNGVRVNNVKPGLISTEMLDAFVAQQSDPESYTKWNDEIQWMGRAGKPEEVAYAVLFLASDQASFITGAELFVSGGYEYGEGKKILSPFTEWGTPNIQ